ncbi:Cytoplasmic tRNA 2-thiolation protein 2 [Elasticomyces elasticus]|uniref:Cytoplasmic tRNA 2-thiolation protein 2 n=1 Tax=Exophiala sideris TaxID=1016849 RepID=A0ABR0JJR6_9EURO|nr:Cytoplasmic tRNA 2-thiolation protein 2 [Elasticomyces elasticus]KAK5034290.1 Cytoplasmic tRNA 2-thiolation protein 2 [Exophiala sideris]KAK5042587.1 Cytoplasmic tRNA 2-thiolation protein 2 [Exophiala sideris]KAK5065669.1 Cytoplasmic tRNA 2-thiolation protein 2 [Exophiala sideris]KAK5185873.1 Cytoplasmic tRNA 2-thiolation protein 2 [Eurotiomycetes sp. CCFEE 6388]
MPEDQKCRLFLPVSGGISSLVLLQILDGQLQRQVANRNRTAYDIVVARVVLPGEEEQPTITGQSEDLKTRFPTHTFLPLLELHDVLRLDSKISHDLEYLGIAREEDESDKELFDRLISSTTSNTARADLQSILLQRLLVATAKREGCEGILWGHSDTRLAALALADVAKGRGGSVSSTIADGSSMHGIDFSYPLRELYEAELRLYGHATSEPLLVEAADYATPVKAQANIRATSIDDLLSTYITSQGEKYPSIMANVVRTASKLEARRPDGTIAACRVCVMPMTGGLGGQTTTSDLCYGCQRMRQDIRT